MSHRTRSRPFMHAGTSLIEVMIAIGLLTIFASSVFIYIESQLLSSVGTQRSMEALSLAREGLDASRAIRDTGWSSLTTGTHGLLTTSYAWSFNGTSDTNGGYRRWITVTDISANERQVVSNVSWTDAIQRAQTTSLATNMSNWRTAVPDQSPPLLTGDWTNPRTLGSVDLGAGNAGTGLAVKNGYVYMSALASSAAKNDFYVIDATSGTTPSVLTSINTGPGLNALAVKGDFAYLANSDVTNQLQIVNISATTSPQLINGGFRLTGNTSPAISIAVTGTLALIGTSANAGSELYLVDVSNPTVPLIKSTIKVSGNVNRISILNNRAFLATSSSTKEFMIVDISNPTNPVVTASVDLPGANAALSLYVNFQDGRAFIGRVAVAGTSPEINVYDIRSPDAPVKLGSLEFGDDVSTVYAVDKYLFMGVYNNNLEFQVYDVASTTNMTYVAGLNFPAVAQDLAFWNNTVYMAVRSNDALRIITSQ